LDHRIDRRSVTVIQTTGTEVSRPQLKVELLRGGRIVFADGRIVERYGRRSTLLLLAYLALFQKRVHLREEIMDILWPDLSPTNARNNLNVALSALRSLVGAALHTDRYHVQLKVETDVLELERTRNPDTTRELCSPDSICRG
jgi:DNA-binding SARP family transcriptional activator